MAEIKNYFLSEPTAERYSKGRFYFHPLAIERVRDHFAIKEPVEQALDVGCGTGLSAKALLPIAKNILAIDASQAMLSQCEPDSRITYMLSSAEKLPASDHSIDLITVSQGIHWFDISRFFSEAYRVLKGQGKLVIYDNFFASWSQQDKEFSKWLSQTYYMKYPPPPRNNFVWEDEKLAKELFEKEGEKTFTSELTLGMSSVINFLVTQSNAVASIHNELTDIEEMKSWLAEELRNFFHDNTQRICSFENKLEYFIRK